MIRDVNMPFNVNEFFKEFIKYIITLLLNIFLGWTLIGWVVALVWAVSPDAIPVVFYDNNNSSKASEKTDELIKFKQLLDSGAITQEEYDKEKNRILNR